MGFDAGDEGVAHGFVTVDGGVRGMGLRGHRWRPERTLTMVGWVDHQRFPSAPEVADVYPRTRQAVQVARLKPGWNGSSSVLFSDRGG